MKQNMILPIEAKIKQILSDGTVKLGFTARLLIPSNISVINSSAINLTVLAGRDSDPTNLGILTWYTEDFSSTEVVLKVTFDNPLFISSRQVRKWIFIKIEI